MATKLERKIGGFVRNEGTQAFFRLQRRVPPGGKVSLESLYLTVKNKTPLLGEDLVNWLKQNFFREDCWKFYTDTGELYQLPETEVVKVKGSRAARGAGKVVNRKLNDGKGQTITPDKMVLTTIEEALVLIGKCKDRNVLKKALTLTKRVYGKEAHMRAIIRRLEQVY